MANTVKDFASPNGPILLLSAKGLTTAGIAEADGVKDFSGNGNHGKGNNGVTVEKYGGYDCFGFPNNNSYIYLSDKISTIFTQGSAYTYSVSFIVTSKPTRSNGILIMWSYSMPANQIWLTSDYKINVVANADFSAYTASTAVELDKLYTVTVSANYASGVRHIYVNGVLVSTSTRTAGNITLNVTYMILGNHSGSTGYNLPGYIIDARIYPRALSAAEVKYLYNGFQPNIIVGQNTLSSIQVGSSTVERVYSGNSLVYAKTNDYEVIPSEVIFELHQINEATQPYPIVYSGKNANFSGITYSNGTPNLGGWKDWIDAHFTPVMLRSNGTVGYELNRDNQNYKKDGTTASDVANINYDGNAMLRIKKFYLSCSTAVVGSGSSAYSVHTVKISDTKKDSSYTCWGFVDANGREKDYVYYALYNCHKDSNNKLRSISGITLNDSRPGNQLLSYNDMVAAAKANGTGWDISNLALENAIGLVLMMLYKSVNPTFINQEYVDLYKQAMSIYQVTGTRNADGGFPYVTATQKQKALWIESFWRNYDNINQSRPWINGLSSLRTGTGGNDFLPYYRKQPPYDDFTTISNWTPMSSTTPHAYMTDAVSHELKTVMFYDNIMFPKDDGVARRGSITAATINRYFGGGEISGSTSTSLQYTDRLLPAQTCGGVMQDQYCSMPHYLGYSLVGTGINSYQKYGSGRLIYMPG